MKILELIDVTKHFDNIIALKNVTFSIQQGEILGLIGPNGAGKTTIVNVITGMVPYASGDILFCGKSIRGLKAHQIGTLGISRTFELVPPATQMTAVENVMVGALFGYSGRKRSVNAARRKAIETLDFLGLDMKKDIPSENLNGLQRKGLEIAVALATNPKLLLLDEIMSGLNPYEIEQVGKTVKKIRNEGVTILVIEHVMRAIVNLSDRLLVLHHGEKILEGPVEQVLSNERVIEAYLGNRYKDLLMWPDFSNLAK